MEKPSVILAIVGIIILLIAGVARADMIATPAYPVQFIFSGYSINYSSNLSNSIQTTTTTYLNISINSTWAWFNMTAPGNLVLSNLTYSSGNWSFNGSGTAGTMRVSAKVANASGNYDFLVNNVWQSNQTAASGMVYFSYSPVSTYGFRIQENTTSPIVPPPTGGTLDETLLSLTVVPHKILKCQASTITAEFGNTANMTGVNLSLETVKTGLDEEYPMSNIGGDTYQYVYGNDNTTVWGNKSIYFDVIDINGILTLPGNDYVFVYSDNCIGTNLSGASNISIGLGTYTSSLQTNNDFFQWVMSPYIAYWGYAFYVIVMFSILVIIYNKNQKMNQVILIAVISLIMLGASGVIPEQFRSWVQLALIITMGVGYWKVFKT